MKYLQPKTFVPPYLEHGVVIPTKIVSEQIIETCSQEEKSVMKSDILRDFLQKKDDLQYQFQRNLHALQIDLQQRLYELEAK